MREVGAYEAKTHLPRLLKEVQRGESVLITSRGIPVARLVPVEPGPTPEEMVERGRRLRALVKPLGPRGVSELIEEGRRF